MSEKYDSPLHVMLQKSVRAELDKAAEVSGIGPSTLARQVLMNFLAERRNNQYPQQRLLSTEAAYNQFPELFDR